MNPISGLSVIIIARNEERDLPDCLKSVQGLANDIVVVDSGSTDKTLEVAVRFGARVFIRDWTGYGPQKQFALEKALGPWIINLDADERLSPELQKEIRETLAGGAAPAVNGFDIPFRHYFLGKRVRFGGARGESHVRLFKKEHALYGDKRIHEGISVTPPVAPLKNSIDHFSYHDLHEYFEKCNLYTSLIAEEKYAKGERFSFFHHLRLPYEFVTRYFFKLGFLDGGTGLTYALLSSYYVWLKYVKLRDLESEKKKGV